MSVEKQQIDWSECPIGRKCEVSTRFLEKELESAKSRHSSIIEKLDDLHNQTSKLSGKLTLITTVFLAVTAAVSGFLFDLLRDILQRAAHG